MTDKELRHLSRVELIDILYELQKQNEEKSAQIDRLNAALQDRTLRLANAGSLAEAALSVNGVFEAAQAAADQYLASLQAAQEAQAQRLEETERRCGQMLEEAHRQAEEIVASAEARAAEKRENFEQRARDLIRAHEEFQSLLEEEKKEE